MNESRVNFFEMAERVNPKASFLTFIAVLASDSETDEIVEAAQPSSFFGSGGTAGKRFH